MSVHSLPSLVRKEKNSPGIPAEPRLKTLLLQEKSDLCSVNLWRAAFAEFVGTGLLCLVTIGFGLTPEGGQPPPVLQVAIGVGFFIGVLLTAFSNVSGAHVNPAISLGFFLTGHCTFIRCIIYTLFQVMGAVTGSGILKFMSPSGHVGSLGVIQPHPDISDEQAMAAEMLITFFLVFVTVAMIDPGRKDVEGSVPLMVGLTVTVNILFAHSTSGGCMNPARAIGPVIVTGKWSKQWIYWLGPLTGSTVGALLYDLFFSATKLRSKRWCNPRNYSDLGHCDSDDDDEENDEINNNNDDDDGDRVLSEEIPLRNGNLRLLQLLDAPEERV